MRFHVPPISDSQIDAAHVRVLCADNAFFFGLISYKEWRLVYRLWILLMVINYLAKPKRLREPIEDSGYRLHCSLLNM